MSALPKTKTPKAVPPFAAAAPKLVELGYSPIPIQPGEKRPARGLRAWQEYVYKKEDTFEGCGIGILTGKVIALDIDVRVKKIAAAIRQEAIRRFGEAPARIGLAPKVALLYAVEGAPFEKIQTREFAFPDDSPDDKGHKVEVLAKGQQLVCYHVHPDTGKPYEWNGAGEPLKVAVDKLARVTKEQCAQFIEWCEALLAKTGKACGRLKSAVSDALRLSGEQRAEDPGVLRSALAMIPNEDEEYDGWITICYAIKGALGEEGREDWLRWSALSSKKHQVKESEKSWKAAKPKSIGAGTIYHLAMQRGWKFPIRALANTEAIEEGDYVLETTKSGLNRATLPNLLHTLSTSLTVAIGYDTFRGRIMVMRELGKWEPIKDVDFTRLRKVLEQELGYVPVGKELMRDALELVADEHQFDSAIEWLNSLPAWDGVPRMEKFFPTYCGTEDTPYTRAVGRYMWTGLASRVLDPGCQLDMVVALFSEQQGLYKSTALQCLVPDAEMFTDGLHLDRDDDNFKRLLKGKLIGEIAEMSGVSKADNADIKRVITRRVEEWVEKYQTQSVRYPRRCMFFATTNDRYFLPRDESGQRRWLPLEIVRIDREKAKRDSPQLWAEGRARALQLTQARKAAGGQLTGGVDFEEAERLAAGLHAKHEQRDVWEGAIEKWLEMKTDGKANGERALTTAEVLEGAVLIERPKQDKRSEMRVASVLRQLGFAKRRIAVNKKQVERWIRRSEG